MLKKLLTNILKIYQRRIKKMEMKFCNKCQSVKAVTLFSKKSASPDGLQQYCKDCNRKDNKQYRQDKPEFFKEWYNKNAENRFKAKAATKKSNSRWGGGVYAVVNTIDNKMYIGCTNMFARRKAEHFNKRTDKFIDNIHQNEGLKVLYKDIKRLGRENFQFLILEIVDTEDQSVLFKRENYWLNFFGSKELWVYNINIGNSSSSKYYEEYSFLNLEEPK